MVDNRLPAFNPNENSAVVPFFFMHEGEECVKIQIAGETRFTPVYRANDMWERDGLQEITYADRWPEQYAQFKNGVTQVADGTSLEELPFLNQPRIAELRQLKIYSVEALSTIDDRNIQRLGGKGYELKNMAREWLDKRMQRGSDSKIAEMQQQIEALTALLQQPPAYDDTLARTLGPQSPIVQEDRRAWLKEQIKAKTGKLPAGQPSDENLERIWADLNAE